MPNIYADSSKELPAIEPLLLVESRLQRQFWVIHILLVPLPVALAEDGLPDCGVEVDHFVVDEGGEFGLWQL